MNFEEFANFTSSYIEEHEKIYFKFDFYPYEFCIEKRKLSDDEDITIFIYGWTTYTEDGEYVIEYPILAKNFNFKYIFNEILNEFFELEEMEEIVNSPVDKIEFDASIWCGKTFRVYMEKRKTKKESIE